MKALYQESNSGVFTWTPPSTTRPCSPDRVLRGDAISITRQFERSICHRQQDHDQPGAERADSPHRRRARHGLLRHLDFADNKDGAQQFLIDYIDAFHDGFTAGQVLQFSVLSQHRPHLKQKSPMIRGHSPDKYKVLVNVLDWAPTSVIRLRTAAIAEACQKPGHSTMLPKWRAATKLRRTRPRPPKRIQAHLLPDE